MLHEIPTAARPAAKAPNAARPRTPAADAPAANPEAPAGEPDTELEPAPSASPSSTGKPPEQSAGTGNPTEQTGATPQANGTGLLPARLVMPWPAVSTGYHVYEVLSQDASHGAPAQPGGPAPAVPKRLTTAPLKQTTFAETSVQYGVERCYLVRTVETTGGSARRASGRRLRA